MPNRKLATRVVRRGRPDACYQGVQEDEKRCTAPTPFTRRSSVRCRTGALALAVLGLHSCATAPEFHRLPPQHSRRNGRPDREIERTWKQSRIGANASTPWRRDHSVCWGVLDAYGCEEVRQFIRGDLTDLHSAEDSVFIDEEGGGETVTDAVVVSDLAVGIEDCRERRGEFVEDADGATGGLLVVHSKDDHAGAAGGVEDRVELWDLGTAWAAPAGVPIDEDRRATEIGELADTAVPGIEECEIRCEFTNRGPCSDQGAEVRTGGSSRTGGSERVRCRWRGRVIATGPKEEESSDGDGNDRCQAERHLAGAALLPTLHGIYHQLLLHGTRPRIPVLSRVIVAGGRSFPVNLTTGRSRRMSNCADSRPKVLVIEDEETLLFTLKHNLKREGYNVFAAARGDDGLRLAREQHPDLIVLDLMLPGIDGMQLCRLLRRDTDVPIIMVTALGGEGDRVAGLDCGADDYVAKPFGMRELMARIRALLRRSGARTTPDAGPPVVTSGDLELDRERREVRLDGIPMKMKPKEMDLLLFFAQHRGRVLSREQILDEVWGYDFYGGPRTVDVHVRWIRQKIEADAAHPTRLRTVRGSGYLFEG